MDDARLKRNLACSGTASSSAECASATSLVQSLEERSQLSREDLGKRPIDCNKDNVKENRDYNKRYYVAADGEVRSFQGATVPCSGTDFSANEEARQTRLLGLECAQAKAKAIQRFLIVAGCKSSGYGNNKCNHAEILKEVNQSFGKIPRPFYIYGNGPIDCKQVLGGSNV